MADGGDGKDVSASPFVEFNALADSTGWAAKKHYSTIRMQSIGDKLYVFGRGSSDLHLFSFDTVSSTWSHLPGFNALADSTGWAA